MTKLQKAVQTIDALMLALNCIKTAGYLPQETHDATGKLLIEVAEINKQLRHEASDPAVTY